ncbi:valine--pyruvate transaminase [Stieleria varia]|uniref:Valine--pyruvate aminotransferase n=1 Tax=Stieleria varia TaxID=2528005 RepID=A0A5C6B9I6_9BACT|nr:valine--pyruvate transaminase [Stieleria varia]TWU07926.1 Valine--pyruvate aminotransferase [Stieleria varia]
MPDDSENAAPTFSEFGSRLCQGSGIGELMDDLGNALASGGDQICMLGGGQPAHIDAIDAIWQQRVQSLCDEPGVLARVLGNYEPPAGGTRFRTAIADLMRREFGWEIGPENVAVTSGGQTAFFLLFNALAGRMPDGTQRKVLLPLVPEYIGYADQSVGGDMFRAVKPKIEMIGSHEFKYRVDFDNLVVTPDIAAICVSRPTNPSGNVLTDEEIHRLAELAQRHDIPLIIDNAYGAPFPGAIYTPAHPVWNENIILTLSLSKLGLPGTRTGIVIAKESIARAVSSMTSIVGLANNNVGQAIIRPLVENGEILRLSREVIRPFYEDRSRKAIRWAHESFDDALPYRLHRSEGAFFLWLWMEDLPITSRELYQRLKARDVLVVPGNYFFYGLDDIDWPHRDQCLRLTYTMPDEIVQRGLAIIGEEMSHAYRGE